MAGAVTRGGSRRCGLSADPKSGRGGSPFVRPSVTATARRQLPVLDLPQTTLAAFGRRASRGNAEGDLWRACFSRVRGSPMVLLPCRGRLQSHAGGRQPYQAATACRPLTHCESRFGPLATDGGNRGRSIRPADPGTVQRQRLDATLRIGGLDDASLFRDGDAVSVNRIERCKIRSVLGVPFR